MISALAASFSVTLPIWVISLILISLLCLRLPKERLEVFLGEEPLLDRKSLTLYALLFLLCMCTVLRLLTWQIMLALVILVLLIFDRPRLLTADFWLLLTFVCFFVFSGNLARMDAVKALLQKLAARARAAGRCGGESGHKQCTGGAPALRFHR